MEGGVRGILCLWHEQLSRCGFNILSEIERMWGETDFRDGKRLVSGRSGSDARVKYKYRQQEAADHWSLETPKRRWLYTDYSERVYRGREGTGEFKILTQGTTTSTTESRITHMHH